MLMRQKDYLTPSVLDILYNKVREVKNGWDKRAIDKTREHDITRVSVFIEENAPYDSVLHR